MQLTVQLAVLGLVAGAAYGLAAIGLITIYKGSGVLNFAHGAMAMVGTYVYANRVIDGGNEWVAVALGLLTSAAAGALTYLVVMRPLRQAPVLAKTVASFGVLLVLQAIGELRWEARELRVPPLFSPDFVFWGDYSLSENGLWTILICILLAVVFFAFFAFSTTGKAIEASAIDEKAAQRLGYRVDVLALLAWTLGGAAAGAAGILIAPNIGLTQVNLTLIVVQALVGAMVGGFRRLGPAVVASFAVGAAEAIFIGRITTPGWRESLPFFAIVAVLLLRGQPIPARESVVTQRLPAAPYPRLSWLVLPAAAAAVVVPLLLDNFWRQIAVLGVANAVIVLSLVLLTGWLGQISLAQWGVAGLGGFLAGVLMTEQGWSTIPALVVVAAVTFPVGVVIGAPAVRVRGINLAVVTLGAAVALQQLIMNNVWGALGMKLPRPDVFGWDLGMLGQLYFSLAVLAVVASGLWWLRRSRFGKTLVAIRSSERAATAAGIDVRVFKLVTFGLSASIAALGGALWAMGLRSITAVTFGPIPAVNLLAFGFLNGIGVIAGGIAAGIAIGMGPSLLRELADIAGSTWFALLGGVGVIVSLQRYPDGVFAPRRRRPRPAAAAVASVDGDDGP